MLESNATHAAGSLVEAQMITADAPRGAAVRLVSRTVLDRAPHEVTSARLAATAHGIYEAKVNGMPVSECVLAPGWTSYEWRLAWQNYDVTEIVQRGTGAVSIEALVGNGWYRGGLGPWSPLDYGSELGFLGALEIVFMDGHRQTIATSTDWDATTTDVTENSLYNGQRIDSRVRRDSSPLQVRAVEFDNSVLVPQVGPLVRRHEVVRPERIWLGPTGETLVDFGQNLVGWMRFDVTGPAGDEIVIRHAEALEDGQLAMAPLRGAEATDTFVMSGGLDHFEPTFTFHGFRYAEVSGWPGELTADSLEAVVVGSDLRATSTFECSDPRVNRLVSNSVWSQKGNFLSIPTDCPQRDERLGWTGDIAVYAPTAAFQFDVADFLEEWLRDVAAEQRDSGSVPWVVPDVIKLGVGEGRGPDWNSPAAIWADAAVWVPEALWAAYGDVERLALHYPMMAAHVELVESRLSSTGLWDVGFQFGDWLDPDSPPLDAQAAKADPAVVATACLYRSASFLARASQILGNGQGDRWSRLAERTRSAFTANYVVDGIVRSDCATVYALALHFGLLDGDDRQLAAARLSTLVQESGYRATTGFAGTPYVTWALSENGYVDDAYRLLLHDEVPSWLYQVTMGATTMWERWDSVLPDGTLNDPVMTSLNHYALGAVCDWIYQVVAGIRPAEPGYGRVRIEPRPGEGIEWCTASYDSVHGRIDVSWKCVDDRFTLDVTLAPGLSADIVLPDGSRSEVAAGAHTWTVVMPSLDDASIS